MSCWPPPWPWSWRAAVLEAAALGRQDVIVLDMGQVPAMDSSGVGALVRLQTALATRGKRLILANPLPAVADELRLRDLSGFFLLSWDIHPDMAKRRCFGQRRLSPPH